MTTIGSAGRTMQQAWWVPFVAPLATILSACAAGLYVFRTIHFNRETARMRATLDTIEKFQSSDHYRDCVLAFRSAFAGSAEARHATIQDLLQPATSDAVQRRFKVLHLLNHYEMIACGFGSGVLDLHFYANYMRGALVHDWDVAEGFIDAMRRDGRNPHSTPSTIFRKFEGVARQLKQEIAYEQRLRRLGRTEEDIEKIVLACRRDPNLLRASG